MVTPRSYGLAVPSRMFAVAMVVGVLTARSAFLGAPTVFPGETSGTRTPEDDGYRGIWYYNQFTDKEGTRVWRLPAKMAGELARPEVAW